MSTIYTHRIFIKNWIHIITKTYTRYHRKPESTIPRYIYIYRFYSTTKVKQANQQTLIVNRKRIDNNNKSMKPHVYRNIVLGSLFFCPSELKYNQLKMILRAALNIQFSFFLSACLLLFSHHTGAVTYIHLMTYT